MKSKFITKHKCFQNMVSLPTADGLRMQGMKLKQVNYALALD